MGGAEPAEARPRYASHRRRRSRGGSARVLAAVPFTYAFQARALYERNGYELVGRVEDFPSGTDVLWYRKRLNPPESPQPGTVPVREAEREHAALMTDPDPEPRGRSMRRIELRPERCSEDAPVVLPQNARP